MSKRQRLLIASPVVPADLDRADLRGLNQLMKRDELDWTAFLRRAVQAYDLMYSRTE